MQYLWNLLFVMMMIREMDIVRRDDGIGHQREPVIEGDLLAHIKERGAALIMVMVVALALIRGKGEALIMAVAAAQVTTGRTEEAPTMGEILAKVLRGGKGLTLRMDMVPAIALRRERNTTLIVAVAAVIVLMIGKEQALRMVMVETTAHLEEREVALTMVKTIDKILCLHVGRAHMVELKVPWMIEKKVGQRTDDSDHEFCMIPGGLICWMKF